MGAKLERFVWVSAWGTKSVAGEWRGDGKTNIDASSSLRRFSGLMQTSLDSNMLINEA